MAMAASGGGGDGTLHNESSVRTAYRYPLNPQALAEQVAEERVLTVTATNGDRLTLILAEFNAFAGNKTYITWENGTRVEKPFPGRTFEGTLAGDPESFATLLIAPEGLYGSVASRGKVWSFQPVRNQQPSPDGTVIQEVASYNVPVAQPATFACVDHAKVGVSVSGQNGSLVQGSAACPLALASCASATGTCTARSDGEAKAGPGLCAGWVDASVNGTTVSCQVGAAGFATLNGTADQEELEAAPDCSTFMEKWSAYSGDASVAVLRIGLADALEAESFVWSKDAGCISIRPHCAEQTRLIEGQARPGTFCHYGGEA